MIKDHTIEEIKNRMDIYEVVSDFVQLKKSGSKSYKALSPFTNERTPSFVVTPSKNIFKCFSSGKGGDSINFIMELEGLSYIEALKYLAQKYGIEVEEEEQTSEQKEAQTERESLFIVMNFAKEHYIKNLWEVDEGRNIGLTYFKERGFSEETIRNFDLGYSIDQWQGLMDAAKESGFKDEYLEKTGLKIVNEDKAYDRFRGRVMFPIHNITGKVIGFGARTLKTHDKKSPKYLNSPETVLYNKSNILYGIFQAKNEIRNQENCYLVEGYTDVISLSQAGVKNVVASSGTALTEDQIKLIKRYTPNITVLFDGDRAGIKASMRGIDMLLEGGMNVSAVPFPEGEDPDSYSRKLGSEPFKTYLNDNAKDFISFKTSIYLDDSDDPIKRANSIREIVNSIALVPDPIQRTVFIQDCSTRLGMEESTLVLEVNKILLNQRKEAVRKEQRDESPIPPVPLPDIESPTVEDSFADVVKFQEKESIRMLINYSDEIIEEDADGAVHLMDYFLSEADDVEFTTPVYEKIYSMFKQYLDGGQILSSKELLNHADDEIRAVAVELSTERYELSPNWMDKHQIKVAHESDSLKSSVYTNILRLKFRIIRKMIADNLENLKSSTDDQEIDKFLKIQDSLKAMEMSIANSLGNVTVK